MDGTGPVALWLARHAVTCYLSERVTMEPPGDLPSSLRERAGIFVTIRDRQILRGCIGTLSATKLTLAHEIIANAISAATADPRFPPVGPEELPSLNFEVDRLSPLERISDGSCLDPSRYGVVVEAGDLRGVLLPGIHGITTTAQQVEVARTKAGILPGAPVALYRFTVIRYREPIP